MSVSDHNRPNPDELLRSIKEEEEVSQKGKLKIFFGMSPGVGKTYAMLQAARIDLSKGVNVVVGYVESHNRPETNALLEGLEVIPRKTISYKGNDLVEMDLDAILLRHPYLVLVDELAHTNAPGSRHAKRYQDVLELLDNGINVYTTVNIQHLESRADVVAEITGIAVRETVPDEIFEHAAEVELIDITTDKLLDRLAEGKVYAPEQSQKAIQNFFRRGNITALREMSLRLVADRVERQLKTYMQEKHIAGPWKSGFHLMVLISSSISSAQLIRWARSLSYTLGADLIALHVEDPAIVKDKDKKALSDNIDLARQLGIEVVVTLGDDQIKAIMEVAQRENITHIVVGKSNKQSFWSLLCSGGSFVDRLMRASGNVDVYVIGPHGHESVAYYKKKSRLALEFTSSLKEYIFSAATILGIILLCIPLAGTTGYQSVSLILLFSVSMLALFFRVGPILLVSTISALLWNYFFIVPRYTLQITKIEDILMVVMFFIIALVNGVLTYRIRKQQLLAKSKEERANAMYSLTKELSQATDIQKIAAIAQNSIKKYFNIECYFLLQDGQNRLITKQSAIDAKLFSDSDYSIAQWTFKNEKIAGRFTDTLPSSEYTYYPLKGTHTKIGVIVLKLDKPLNGDLELFLDSFLTQVSYFLEQEYLAQEAKLASILNESDKLYKTLFNSISHELRIPVATVMGASDTLLNDTYPEAVKKELYGEIFIASKRLNRLIENLLNMSRLESGQIAVHLDWCDIRDLFNSVTESLKEELKPFKLDVVVPPTMPLVKLDFGLMERAIYNLVCNSCKYAAPGRTIRLKAFYDSHCLVIQEMDRGSGFPADSLPNIFNKFYKSEQAGGLGLGLSIVKGFVEAHKGVVAVENRQNGGARFTLKIPTEISYSTHMNAEEHE